MILHTIDLFISLVKASKIQKEKPLIMDAFSWHEASSISSTDSEHISGYFNILHSVITSHPEVHTQMTSVSVIHNTRN